jgi:hypothetical protein
MYNWLAFQVWMNVMSIASFVNYTDEICRLDMDMFRQAEGLGLGE